MARMPHRRAPRVMVSKGNCHSQRGNILVLTLRPDLEDLIREWTRPRISVVTYVRCYRRRSLALASPRRAGLRHAGRRGSSHLQLPQASPSAPNEAGGRKEVAMRHPAGDLVRNRWINRSESAIMTNSSLLCFRTVTGWLRQASVMTMALVHEVGRCVTG